MPKEHGARLLIILFLPKAVQTVLTTYRACLLSFDIIRWSLDEQEYPLSMVISASFYRRFPIHISLKCVKSVLFAFYLKRHVLDIQRDLNDSLSV